jgi:hypothetical protein
MHRDGELNRYATRFRLERTKEPEGSWSRFCGDVGKCIRAGCRECLMFEPALNGRLEISLGG